MPYVIRWLGSLWREERGTTSLTLIWFMLFALSLAIALDAFFGIYITLQQARTASDAATLATSRAIAALLPATVEDEAAERVHRVVSDSDAQQDVQSELESLEASQAACALFIPICTPMTAEEWAAAEEGIKVRAYRKAFARLYRGTLSSEMARMVVKGTWHQADVVDKRDQLIPDDTDLGCLVQHTATTWRSEILQQAESLAQQNGAILDWDATALAQSSGLHRVVILRTVRPFGAEWIFPDGNYPKLRIPNLVKLTKVGQRTPQYIPSC